MSGLGISAIGRLPIGALRVPARGPQYSSLRVSGVGALAAAAASLAAASLASSGVGALAAISGPASGSMQSSGVGAFTLTSASRSSGAVTSVGSGSFAGALAALGSTSMSAAGAGVFLPIISAGVSSSVMMQGQSGMGASDAPSSAASFGGVGAFAGVGYAFFADAEVAGPLQEVRIAIVLAEPLRAVVVLAENRVYPEPTRPSAPVIPNRKRLL